MAAQAFVCAHCGRMQSATRQLNAQLSADHGLTISDFEVLLRLGQAPDRRLRRVDLAERAPAHRVGDHAAARRSRAERATSSERSCAGDRRVVYAVLTDDGLHKLREAAESHFAQVDGLFRARFEDAELDELTALLARLGGNEPANCEPPES